MEIQQLKYFVEVVRQQSFTKAAAQLFSHICDHFASLDHQSMDTSLRGAASSV